MPQYLAFKQVLNNLKGIIAVAYIFTVFCMTVHTDQQFCLGPPTTGPERDKGVQTIVPKIIFLLLEQLVYASAATPVHFAGEADEVKIKRRNARFPPQILHANRDDLMS